jgi:hypothetical protein
MRAAAPRAEASGDYLTLLKTRKNRVSLSLSSMLMAVMSIRFVLPSGATRRTHLLTTRPPYFATMLTACTSSTVSEYMRGVFVPLI